MTRFRPNLEELRAARASGHRAAVVGASVVMDGETPLSCFARLDGDPGGAFLFESVEGGERTGRWSFFGSGLASGLVLDDQGLARFGPDGRAPLDGSPLDAVREALAEATAYVGPELPPFGGGLLGHVAFDALARFEPVPIAPGAASAPELQLMAADAPFAYDHADHAVHALTRVPLDDDLETGLARARAELEARLARLAEPIRLAPFNLDGASAEELEVEASRSQEDFERSVREAKQAILDGEIFQVVLSTRFTVRRSVAPLSLYRALRALNPSPYMFLLRPPDGPALVGASPEVLVRVDRGDVLVRPIAGTRRRGRTLAEDLALERELLADAKERAEHMMLLDLGRNDVGRVAAPGTVRVEAPLHIERYAHVMHMVSDVHGRLHDEADALDAFRAGFPAGTVCGAPKLRAAELIATLETDRRGPYAGAVGYFDPTGQMDTCIAIRTAVVHADRVEVQAGAGIVHDSEPELEWKECRNKARSPLTAVALAASGRCDVAGRDGGGMR